jgi:hypothetical protein
VQLIGTAFLFFEAKAEAGLKYGPKGRGVVLLPRKMRKTGTANTAQAQQICCRKTRPTLCSLFLNDLTSLFA